MKNFILFGPPGSGKGTQSDKLVEKFGFLHLSTGNLLRTEIEKKTTLGIEAKSIMDKGELVPDIVVIKMIENEVAQNLQIPGFLFDGFPRTIAQSEALDNLLLKFNTQIDLVFSLEVDEKSLINRLLHRGNSSGRTDDNIETIELRLKEYKKKTTIVADYYIQHKKLIIIKGIGTIDEIFNNISSHINNLK